ncbi:MAG TPA: PAS domain S-box protein, partial [Planctomycetota bacterium]|nr:PAS domain S-box protein [Planctomycetota bacterium]
MAPGLAWVRARFARLSKRAAAASGAASDPGIGRRLEAQRLIASVAEAYFTSSPLALFVSNARGVYLEVNGAACALTGYGREQLVGQQLADLIAGGDARQLADRLLGLIALGSGSNEIQVKRRDGRLRNCLVHASTVGTDRVLWLVLDITDRKEAEQKLRESEERFRGLSEAAFEAILVHDGGRIVDVNHALCELVGYSWHELAGRDGFELIVPEYREAVYRNLLGEYTGAYEIEVLKRDGSRVPVEIQARSFPYRGQVLRVVAVRDISERKRAERV